MNWEASVLHFFCPKKLVLMSNKQLASSQFFKKNFIVAHEIPAIRKRDQFENKTLCMLE